MSSQTSSAIREKRTSFITIEKERGTADSKREGESQVRPQSRDQSGAFKPASNLPQQLLAGLLGVLMLVSLLPQHHGFLEKRESGINDSELQTTSENLSLAAQKAAWKNGVEEENLHLKNWYDYGKPALDPSIDPDGRLGKGVGKGAIKGGFAHYDNLTQMAGGFIGEGLDYVDPFTIPFALSRDISAAGYYTAKAAINIYHEGLNWSNGTELAASGVGLFVGGKVIAREGIEIGSTWVRSASQKSEVLQQGVETGVNWVKKSITQDPGLGGNPFKNQSPEKIDQILKNKGYNPRGPDPAKGYGGYVSPNRSYHIDPNNSFGEPPHVDVNRPKSYKGPLDKRKYFIDS